MKMSDAIVVSVLIITVGAILGAGIPSCMKKHREAIVECSKLHPPLECETALRE